METKEKRLENLAEVGYKARREVEDFLNRWLSDNTKGWTVRPNLVSRHEDRLSTSMAITLN